jgi:hypothetical protein
MYRHSSGRSSFSSVGGDSGAEAVTMFLPLVTLAAMEAGSALYALKEAMPPLHDKLIASRLLPLLVETVAKSIAGARSDSIPSDIEKSNGGNIHARLGTTYSRRYLKYHILPILIMCLVIVFF